MLSPEYFFYLLLWLPGLVVFYGMSHRLISILMPVHFGELRIALLGAAVYSVVYLLSGITDRSGELAELTEIRRDLALGTLNAEVGSKRLEIALSGLRLSDFVSGQVRDVLEVLRRVDSRLDSTSRALETLENLPPLHRSEIAERQEVAIQALVDLMVRHLVDAGELIISELRGRNYKALRKAWILFHGLKLDPNEGKVMDDLN